MICEQDGFRAKDYLFLYDGTMEDKMFIQREIEARELGSCLLVPSE